MNFILVDAPNFVLLGASWEGYVRRPPGQPQYLNQAFSHLVRVLGLTPEEEVLSNLLSFDGVAVVEMRRLLDRYGFDLPPLTVGELYGLLEYCDRLDAFTGNGVFTADQLSQWHSLNKSFDCDWGSPWRLALDLYSSGDLRSLRSLHRELGTLARLGLAYRATADSLSRRAPPP